MNLDLSRIAAAEEAEYIANNHGFIALPRQIEAIMNPIRGLLR